MKGFYRWFKAFFNFGNRYLFLSLFISLLLTSTWFANQKLGITNFSNIIPGIATFDNVDINKRLSLFYISVFLIAGLFTGCIILSYFFDKKFGRYKYLVIPWNRLSILGIAFLFLKLFNIAIDFSLELLFSLFISLFLFQIARYKFHHRLFGFTIVSFIWIAAISLCCCFFVRELILVFTEKIPFELSIIYLICFLFIICFLIFLSYLTKWKFKSIFIVSLPFFALPLFTILSEEVYMILNQRNIHILSPIAFYLIIVIICFAVSAALLYIKKKKSYIYNYKRYIYNYIFPLILFGIVIFTQYTPFIGQPEDMFEFANPANAIMRLFNFHEFPIVQALSSHLLSDIGLKPLYILFNGYNGSLDFIIYDFIISTIFILLLYFFLKKIFNDAVFAFILIMFFPFLPFAILDNHVLIFGTIFLIGILYKRYSFNKLLLLGFWSIFLICWRIEVGVSSVCGSIFLMGLYLITNFKKELLIDILKAFALIGVSLLAIALSVIFIWHINLWENFMQAREYFGANQAHGFPDIAFNHDRLYFYHYFIFPVIAILTFLFVLFKYRKEQSENIRFLNLALLFLIIYYFANAQRGLVRHSIFEGSDLYISSFFYLLIALFSYYLTRQYKYAKYIFIAVFIFIVNNFELPSNNNYQNNYERLCFAFKMPRQVQKVNYKINRVTETDNFAKRRYTDFKQLLDNNFEPDATFIDFSNSPMLYFYTKRRVPSYFNQYMQNTVTENLQLKNIKYLKQLNIPIVVFSSVPETIWDNLDSVPNTIRHNKIVRYIYKNYQPYTVLNGHYIWVKKGEEYKIKNSLSFKVDPGFVKTPNSYNLKQYPYILAKSSNFSSRNIVYKLWNKNETNLTLDSIKINNIYDNYLMLKILYQGENSTEIGVKYSEQNNELGSFRFTVIPSTSVQSYIIPLSSQYNWISQKADMITISGEIINEMIFEEIYLFAKNVSDEDCN